MDPRACLLRAIAAMGDGDREECADATNDYRTWRASGGFEPEYGDRACDVLEAYSCGDVDGYFTRDGAGWLLAFRDAAGAL